MDFSNITVVITTFRSNHKIFSCIDSIPKELKIIIIENSDDFKFKEKVENYRANVDCFLLKLNLGYSYGNNFGLLKVKTKYALVINPDVRLKNDTLNYISIILSNFLFIFPSTIFCYILVNIYLIKLFKIRYIMF